MVAKQLEYVEGRRRQLVDQQEKKEGRTTGNKIFSLKHHVIGKSASLQ